MDLLPKKPLSTTNPDDGIGRGMEFAILTAFFLGFGYLLDRWLDTRPLFMIILVVIAVVGQFAAMRYRYEGRMQQLEDERAAKAQHRTRAS